MDYHVINTTRSRANRLHRVQQAGRLSFKQFLGPEQLRSVRSRPIVVDEAWVRANLEELRQKSATGCIEIRTADGCLVDLATLQPEAPKASSPEPHPPLDSAANDENRGRFYPKFEDGATLDEAIDNANAVRQAQVEMMAEPTPAEESDEEEVEFTEQPTQTTQGGRRNRRR